MALFAHRLRISSLRDRASLACAVHSREATRWRRQAERSAELLAEVSEVLKAAGVPCPPVASPAPSPPPANTSSGPPPLKPLASQQSGVDLDDNYEHVAQSFRAFATGKSASKDAEEPAWSEGSTLPRGVVTLLQACGDQSYAHALALSSFVHGDRELPGSELDEAERRREHVRCKPVANVA